MAVDVQTAPDFEAGKPRLLFEGNYAWQSEWFRNYDISADGTRFVMVEALETPPAQIDVVLNWMEEVQRLVSGNR